MMAGSVLTVLPALVVFLLFLQRYVARHPRRQREGLMAILF